MNLNIAGIAARTREEAQAAVERAAAEALSGAVSFQLDDLVPTRETIMPIAGGVTKVPVEWHAQLLVTQSERPPRR